MLVTAAGAAVLRFSRVAWAAGLLWSDFLPVLVLLLLLGFDGWAVLAEATVLDLTCGFARLW